MGIPQPFQYNRVNPQSLDSSDVFPNLVAFEEYIQSGIAYAGQIVAVRNGTNKPDHYIVNEDFTFSLFEGSSSGDVKPKLFDKIPTDLTGISEGELIFVTDDPEDFIPEIGTPITGNIRYEVERIGSDGNLLDHLADIRKKTLRYVDAHITIDTMGYASSMPYQGTVNFNIPQGVKSITIVNNTNTTGLTQSDRAARLNIIGHSSCVLTINIFHVSNMIITGFKKVHLKGRTNGTPVTSNWARFEIEGNGLVEISDNFQIDIDAAIFITDSRILFSGTIGNQVQRLRITRCDIIDNVNAFTAANIKALGGWISVTYSTLVGSPNLIGRWTTARNYISDVAPNPQQWNNEGVVEIDFGDGTYGVSESVSVAAAANVEHTYMFTIPGASADSMSIISVDGYFGTVENRVAFGGFNALTTTGTGDVVATGTNLVNARYSNVFFLGSSLCIKTKLNTARTLPNGQTEYWIRYRKQTS